jgi:DMSO/TMAO reductase YedYZ molybdopterin-dependent catalytic subunit
MTFLADRGPISASRAWSGVAKLGGVPMRHILDLVRPTADARYAVFYSLADAGDTDRYYDVHKIANMRRALTLLAYEMNGVPVSVLHGAPLRLRCENELGFKIVKWIAAIEFVIEFVGDFEVLALVRADIMKTMNSMATGCRSERSGVEDR